MLIIKTIITKIVIQNLSVVKNINFNIVERGKMNEHIKNRKKTDLTFKLASFMRNQLYKVCKAQNVMITNKRFDLLGCSHSFFQRRVIHQLYGYMTIENYGSVRQIDHCLPIASFNLFDENGMKKFSIGLTLDLCILTKTTRRRIKLIII